MSASRLRPLIHKLGRSNSSYSSLPGSARSTNNTRPVQNGSGSTDERTSLLNHIQSEINPHDKKHLLVRGPRKLAQTIWLIIISNYINVLLIFVPFGIIAGAVGWPAIAIFVLNFLAIIPLASLLSFATEELAVHLGPSIGGLLNATFGNAIELIVCIVALTKDEIRIIQASMLGSILANILLVLGACFIAGGIRRLESIHQPRLASTMSSLQAVAASSLTVPAVLWASLQETGEDAHINIKTLSRGTAVILLVLYILYLFFQLKSHGSLFDGEEENDIGDDDEGEGRKEGDTLNVPGALVTLVVITVLVAFCAEFLVGSIDEIVESTPLSKTFIGLILIPIVSNAAEHVTAVIVSWKGKMNLALCVDMGSSLQIALFVTPFLVILGWILDKPMTLQFHGFELFIFFLSIVIVNGLIRDGKSNYLEGCMCLGWYIIIAIAFYVYPEDPSPGWLVKR